MHDDNRVEKMRGKEVLISCWMDWIQEITAKQSRTAEQSRAQQSTAHCQQNTLTFNHLIHTL
jgi:hypothetical protein